MTPLDILLIFILPTVVVCAEYPYVIFLNSSSMQQQHVVYSIGDLHWYMAHLDEEKAQQLQGASHVVSLHKDVTLFHTSEQVQTDLPSWGLDRIDQREGGDDQYHFPSSAGEGVNVYLIDTGVNIDHEDFEGRAIHGPTFTSDKDPEDSNGHGSFVAGVCCGKLYGVAKKANVISVKALDQGGSGKLGNILLALHWVVGKHLKSPGSKSIVNLSLAADYHEPTNQAIEEAIKLGVHFSIAAGNQGQEACKYSPASTQHALVVGALDPDDTIASYSNTGSCVDIYAPGTAITSVWHHHPKDIHVLSGTSMAAPHVTGVMAILLSENDYSPSELIQKVKETATTATTVTKNDVEYNKISQLTAGDSYDEIRMLYMEPSSSFTQNSSCSLLQRKNKKMMILEWGVLFMYLLLYYYYY